MMCYVVRYDLARDVVGPLNPTYKIGCYDWILSNPVTTCATSGMLGFMYRNV